MMSRIALTAAFALVAAPALAGGLAEPVATPVIAAPVPVVAVAPSADWSGFYLGAQVGTADLATTANGTETASGNGTIYGLHAGYQRDMGRFVLGGEVDYDMADVTLTDVAGRDALTLDSVLRGKLRLGYDAGRVLPYLTAGIANAGLTEVGTDLDVTASGSFYGIGASFALSDRVTLGGEYLMHSFDTIERDGTEVPGLEAEANTLTLRASYNF